MAKDTIDPWAVSPVRSTREQTRRTYDRLSRWYGSTEGLLEGPAVVRGLRRAQVKPGSRVLDVGCGPGWALSRLQHAAGTAVGLDLSSGMLATARKTCGRWTPLVRGDMTCLPFATGAFDVVFMSFALELLPTDKLPSTMREVFRALRAGGRYVNVSLTLERPNVLTRLYEFGHRHLPALLDCRPLYVGRELEAIGATLVSSERRLLFGLPVEITVARRSAAAE